MGAAYHSSNFLTLLPVAALLLALKSGREEEELAE